MRIAQVACLWSSIPPRNYGGIELLVHLFAEELLGRGHEVTLFASGDSRTNARLCAISPSNIFEAMGRGEAYDYDYYATAAIAEAMRHWDQFIHSHLGASKIPLSIAAKTPIVHTLRARRAFDGQARVCRRTQRLVQLPLGLLSRGWTGSGRAGHGLQQHDSCRGWAAFQQPRRSDGVAARAATSHIGAHSRTPPSLRGSIH